MGGVKAAEGYKRASIKGGGERGLGAKEFMGCGRCGSEGRFNAVVEEERENLIEEAQQGYG